MAGELHHFRSNSAPEYGCELCYFAARPVFFGKMAISAEYLTLLRVGINASPEWKEAWDRINDYLDALKVPEDVERQLVLLSSFEQAIARKRQDPVTPAPQLPFRRDLRGRDLTL